MSDLRIWCDTCVCYTTHDTEEHKDSLTWAGKVVTSFVDNDPSTAIKIPKEKVVLEKTYNIGDIIFVEEDMYEALQDTPEKGKVTVRITWHE